MSNNDNKWHTPGPWRIVDHPSYASMRVVDGPSFRIVCVMSAIDLTWEDGLKREADLRLIAAAPQLLEALKAIAERWPAHGSGTKNEMADAMAAKARAAIIAAGVQS